MVVYITFVLALAPIFKNYGVWIISIPEILMVVGVVWTMMTGKKRNLNKTGSLIVFFTAITFLSIIAASEYPVSYTVTVRFWIYILFIYLFNDSFDFELGCKILVYAALINSVYLLIQDTIWTSARMALQWNIPGLPVKIAEGYVNGQIENVYSVRFSGLFSEPAQFSHYALNAVIILLFKKDLMTGFKRWGILIIIMLAILTSGSGAGAMQLLIITSIFFFITFVRNRRNILPLIGLLILFLLMIEVVVPYLNFSGLNSGFLRVFDDREISTTNSRINFCFKVFDSFPTWKKVFGIGYGNYDYYVVKNFGYLASTYCNSAAYVLCGGGYIGFAFYLYMFWDWFKKTPNIVAKIKVISLVISAIYSGQTLSIDFVLSACFILSCINYVGEKKNGQQDIAEGSVSPGYST